MSIGFFSHGAVAHAIAVAALGARSMSSGFWGRRSQMIERFAERAEDADAEALAIGFEFALESSSDLLGLPPFAVRLHV